MNTGPSYLIEGRYAICSSHRAMRAPTPLRAGLAVLFAGAATALIISCDSTSKASGGPQVPAANASLPGNLAPGGVDLIMDPVQAQTSWDVVRENFKDSDCELIEQCVRAPGERKLLRFNGASINAGDQDLVLGDPSLSSVFEYSVCHEHFHMKSYMLLELLDPVTRAPVLVDGTAAVGRKQAFCLQDTGLKVGTGASKGYDCDNQGLSAGFEDVYDKSLPCQWIDVTGVRPGNYLLRLTVNPDRLVDESNYDNNSTEVPVSIPVNAPEAEAATMGAHHE